MLVRRRRRFGFHARMQLLVACALCVRLWARRLRCLRGLGPSCARERRWWWWAGRRWIFVDAISCTRSLEALVELELARRLRRLQRIGARAVFVVTRLVRLVADAVAERFDASFFGQAARVLRLAQRIFLCARSFFAAVERGLAVRELGFAAIGRVATSVAFAPAFFDLARQCVVRGADAGYARWIGRRVAARAGEQRHGDGRDAAYRKS